MSMQLLIQCSACDKPAPSEGKVRPDVQPETGLVVLSPPKGWYAVLDTTPTKPATATAKDATTAVKMPKAANGAGLPEALMARSYSRVRLVCGLPCAATVLKAIADGLPESFAGFAPRPHPAAPTYRAPMLTLRVTGPFPGNAPMRLDRGMLQDSRDLEPAPASPEG